ncbi:MAG: phosphoenolpyruvate--protein phosphotransferase, partial [Clostridia bacterium]|nr:phosphoenolpyruvate--protein phosphotransferase [Clostridia bacterium]
MRIFSGKGVYGAIAIGKISVLRRDEAKVIREKISDIAGEVARFEEAREHAERELDELYEKALP